LDSREKEEGILLPILLASPLSSRGGIRGRNRERFKGPRNRRERTVGVGKNMGERGFSFSGAVQQRKKTIGIVKVEAFQDSADAISVCART